MRMNLPSEKVILIWLSSIVKDELKNIQVLKDGKALYNILQTINPIEHSSIIGSKPEETCLKNVLRKLECRFNTKFASIDVDKATEGDSDELQKIVMLVLVAGMLSDCKHDFTAPIRSFDDATRLSIKRLINHTVQPHMDLKERSMDLSFIIEDPQNDSQSTTETSPHKDNHPFLSVSPITPSRNNFILADFLSPSTNPFTPNKDVSFNTKLMQTEQRLDNLTTKLRSEKELRSGIEEEMSQKDEEIEKRRGQVRELGERLREMERRRQAESEEMKEQMACLQEKQRLCEEELTAVNERKGQMAREVSDLKERNVFVERHNDELFEENTSLQTSSSKQRLLIDSLTSQLSSTNLLNQQLTEELGLKSREWEELKERLQALQKLHDDQAEVYNYKLQELNDKLNKSLSMEDGECWGDVVEGCLKEEIEDLQGKLQRQAEKMVACESDNSSLCEKVAVLEGEKAQLKTSLEDKSSELMALKDTFKELSTQKSTLEEMNKDLLEELTALKERVAREGELSSEIACLNAEKSNLTKLLSEMGEREERLKGEVKEGSCRLSAMTTKWEQVQCAQEEIDVRVCEQESMIAQLRGEKAEGQGRIEELLEKEKHLDLKVGGMLEEKECLTSEVKVLKSAELRLTEENDNLLKKVSVLEESGVKLNEKIMECEKELSVKESEYAGLMSVRVLQDASISELNGRVQRMKDEHEATLSDLAVVTEAMNALLSKVDDLNSDKQLVADRVLEMEGEESRRLEEIENLKVTVHSLEESETKLKEEVEVLRGELQGLSQQLVAAKETVEVTDKNALHTNHHSISSSSFFSSSDQVPQAPTKRTSKVAASAGTRTRAAARKDGAWNNYGAANTTASATLNKPIVLYTSKTRPDVSRRMTRVIDKGNRQGEEPKKSGAVCGDVAAVADVSKGKKLFSMPKGFGAMMQSEDESEQLEWKLLQRHRNSLGGKVEDAAFKIPTIDNIPKHASASNHLPVSNQLASLSHVNGQSSSTCRSNAQKAAAAAAFTDATFSLDIRRETFLLNHIPEQPEESPTTRLNEIRRRNTLCLPHLKSTYPLEELPCTSKDLKRLIESPEDSAHDNPAYVCKEESFRGRKKKQSPLKRVRKTSLDSPVLKAFKGRASSSNKASLQAPPQQAVKRSRGRQLRDLFSTTPRKAPSSSDSGSIAEQNASKEEQENVAFDVGFTPKKVLKKVFARHKKKKPLVENVDN